MAAHNDFGARAEQAAAALLERNGWTILHRNWRWHHKEIDLIARLDDVVAFVEVRARSRTQQGHPLETIGWKKRRDLEAAALAWIARHARPGDSFRFDAMTVLKSHDGTLALEHVAEAWQV
ncbi:MAG TPA: YraN family protein [Longimicrobiales bacterium]|nr:YraN family protein [Longimicrobiales bacterium]